MRRLCLLALATLSGCTDIEPFSRPYVWTPTGSNAANLAAMAEVPADLSHGRGEAGADGVVAAAAVARLRADQVRPFAGAEGGSTGAAAAGASGGSGAGGGAAGSGAGTAPN